MTIALREKHKLGFIDRTCRKEAQEQGLQDQWGRCSAIALSWLLNSVSKEIANNVIDSQQAHHVRQDPKERYDKVSGSRIFSIHQEINSLHVRI